MIYVLAALILLLFGVLLYKAYIDDREVATLLKGAAMIAAGFFFTTFSRSMIVYKPLMVLHIALTLLYWYGVVLYLLRRDVKISFLAAPLASMTLFFLVAWIFREV